MMEDIKLWTISICGILAFSSIFKLLISDSKLNKTVNIFISILIILYVIKPFKELNYDNEIEVTYESQNSNVLYKEGYEKIVRESIIKICNENNISVISLNIDSYVDDDYYFINKIDLQINTPGDKEKLKSIFKEKLGFEVNIY